MKIADNVTDQGMFAWYRQLSDSTSFGRGGRLDALPLLQLTGVTQVHTAAYVTVVQQRPET